eukprot:jgi/Botrbrau1/23461/Bobra.106_1s0017.1
MIRRAPAVVHLAWPSQSPSVNVPNNLHVHLACVNESLNGSPGKGSFTEKVFLDGFALLSGSQTEFPEDAATTDVSWRGITDIHTPDLQYFCALRVLYADGNLIRDCSPLTSLSKLNMLSLSCNNISSIPPWDQQAFVHLRMLDLSFNKLGGSCIRSLQQLCHLEILNLSGNNLSDMCNTDIVFKELRNLSVSTCCLQTHHLPSLQQFPELQQLSLAQNAIGQLLWGGGQSHASCETRTTCFLTNLKVLDLSMNPLMDARTLSSISFVPTVFLHGTPIQAFTRKQYEGKQAKIEPDSELQEGELTPRAEAFQSILNVDTLKEPQQDGTDDEADPTIHAAKELGMDLSLLAIMTPGIRGGTDFSVKSLQFVLEHPIDHDKLGQSVIPRYAKPTTSSRQIARGYQKARVKKENAFSSAPTVEKYQIAKIEHVLARMKERLLHLDVQIRNVHCLPDALSQGPAD